MADPLHITTGVVYLVSGFTLSSASIGTLTVTGRILAADGTSGAPSYSFTSETTLGFWRSSAGNVTLQGAFTTTGQISSGTNFIAGAGSAIFWSTGTVLRNAANGNLSIANNAETIGSRLKVDALPTVGSGFGGTPAVVAGSTPLAGSVDVGSGGVATSGVITFNGTAFPSTPFVTITCSAGAVPTTVVATTTQLTLTTSVAWPANTIVNWHCISAK
jgi:hypothetical protein